MNVLEGQDHLSRVESCAIVGELFGSGRRKSVDSSFNDPFRFLTFSNAWTFRHRSRTACHSTSSCNPSSYTADWQRMDSLELAALFSRWGCDALACLWRFSTSLGFSQRKTSRSAHVSRVSVGSEKVMQVERRKRRMTNYHQAESSLSQNGQKLELLQLLTWIRHFVLVELLVEFVFQSHYGLIVADVTSAVI